MGQGLLGSAINMILLSLTAAPTVAKYLHCRTLWIALCLPVVISGVFLLTGAAMDCYHWEQHLDDQRRGRSNTWARCFEQLDRIERSLDGHKWF